MSLVGLYTPVFLVCVLLLLFLTRKRDSVDWERVFGANKATAMIEALLSLGYLLVTQLVLGGAFGYRPPLSGSGGISDCQSKLQCRRRLAVGVTQCVCLRRPPHGVAGFGQEF
jgi:hypothetical protein